MRWVSQGSPRACRGQLCGKPLGWGSQVPLVLSASLSLSLQACLEGIAHQFSKVSGTECLRSPQALELSWGDWGGWWAIPDTSSASPLCYFQLNRERIHLPFLNQEGQSLQGLPFHFNLYIKSIIKYCNKGAINDSLEALRALGAVNRKQWGSGVHFQTSEWECSNQVAISMSAGLVSPFPEVKVGIRMRCTTSTSHLSQDLPIVIYCFLLFSNQTETLQPVPSGGQGLRNNLLITIAALWPKHGAH